MSLLMARIASRAFNTPLMIDPAKAAAFVMGLGGRIVDGGFVLPDGIDPADHTAFSGGRPSERMGRLGNRLGREYEAAGLGDRVIDRIGAVGIIPIEGVLVHKGAFLGKSSGEMSYEGIQARIAAASRMHAEGSLRGVVFEVDSFGGEVSGVFDTADMIAELSARMPTIAILTDHALSAGYCLGCAARKVVLPESGTAGSIGVITMHADFSRQVESSGVRVTLVKSGRHKAAGHPLFPLDDDTLARMQTAVDRGREQFAAAVARYRGARLTREGALATEAMIYRGHDAVSAGLADAVARPSVAFEAFVMAMHRR